MILRKATKFVETLLRRLDDREGRGVMSTCEVRHSASFYRNIGELAETRRLHRVNLFDVLEV